MRVSDVLQDHFATELCTQVVKTVEGCLKAYPWLQPSRMLHFYCPTCVELRTSPRDNYVRTRSCTVMSSSIVCIGRCEKILEGRP